MERTTELPFTQDAMVDPLKTPEDPRPEKTSEEWASKLGFHLLRKAKEALRTQKWLLFFLCWALMMQGIIVNGFINVAITTLEKRFDLKSLQTGLVAGGYDIGSILAVVPISYFGAKRGSSKPRYISIGLLIMGVGSLIFTLPHFIVSPYRSGKHISEGNSSVVEENWQVCKDEVIEVSTASEPEASSGELFAHVSDFQYFFIVGQLLHGVGATPVITLCPTLLDESVDRIASPLYMGILYTFSVIGPAVGYLAGGSLLSVYIDFDKAIDWANIDSSSDFWLGCWWLGFVIAWLLSWMCSAFLYSFPNSVGKQTEAAPSTSPSRLEVKTKMARSLSEFKAEALGGDAPDRSLSHLKTTSTTTWSMEEATLSKTVSVGGDLKQLLSDVISLLNNATFMLISLTYGLEGFIVAGTAAFLPKTMELQYGVEATVAAVIIGAVSVLGGGAGVLIGGYAIKRFQMTRQQTLKFHVIAQAIAIPFIAVLLMHCEEGNFAGINRPYESAQVLPAPTTTAVIDGPLLGTGPNLTSSCNAHCAGNCGGWDGFLPVCGSDSISYFNPCYAGCRQWSDTKACYTDCRCVESANKTATTGHCNSECNTSPIAVILLFALVFLTFVLVVPSVFSTLRFVELHQRSLGLGIQSIILRIVGSIPGPIAYGYALDQACLVFRGSCLAYDSYSISIGGFMILFSFKLAALIVMCGALFSQRYSRVKEETANVKEATETATKETSSELGFTVNQLPSKRGQ